MAIIAALLGHPALAAGAMSHADTSNPQWLFAGIAGAVMLVVLSVMLLRRTRQLAELRAALVEASAASNGITAAIPDLIWTKDSDGVYLSCNPACARLFGRDPGEVVGRTDIELAPPTLARQWRKADRTAIIAGRAVEESSWVVFADDGHSALLQITRVPRYDGRGRLSGVLGIGRDITEQHRISTELQRREDYQRALLDNFPFFVWLKDTDCRFLAVNQQIADAAGAEHPAELVGRTDHEVWPADLADSYIADDRAVMATRREREVIEEITGPKGNRWIETYKAPVFDDRGGLLGTVGFARDVSERVRIEHELRDSEQRFRGFFENNSSVLLLIDPDTGRIIAANRSAERFYGYPDAQLTSLTIDALNDLPRESVLTALGRALRAEQSHFEFRHRLAGGEERDVEVYSTPIRSGGRQLLFSIVHDITERKTAEAMLSRERDLFSAGPVVVFTWTPERDRPALHVSSNAGAVLGHPTAEITAPDFRLASLMHPDDVGQVQRTFDRAIANDTDRFEQSYRLRRKDGRYAWYRDFTRVSRADNGQVVSIHSYLFDQSQIKELELSLKDERTRLQNVIEGTRVGTWEWSIETGEVRLNERWAGMIGYRLSELVPVSIDTWTQRIHPDDRLRSEEKLNRHFTQELDHYECEVRVRHRDGHWIWVLSRGRVFERSETGTPLWMAGTNQDITDRKNAELAVIESEDRLRTAGAMTYDLIYERDPANEELVWFGDVDRFLGYAPGEVSHRLDTWLTLIHPDDRPAMEHATARHEKAVEPYEHEYRIRHKDGSFRYWHDKASPLLDEAGRPRKWIGVCTDITEQGLAEERLRLAATVFSHTAEGIIITDAKARIVDVNAAFCKITGYSREEVLGENPRVLSSGRQNREFYAAMWQDLANQGHWSGEMWNRRKNGDVYPQHLSVNAVRDSNGLIVNYVALVNDITDQKVHQEELERIAYFDPLTNLPNRVLLGDRLQQAMAKATRHNRVLAVVYLDLDGFKAINDSWGHDVGDQLLVDVAARLRRAVRNEDTVARLGGDEFVAVLGDLSDAAACIELLPRLLAGAACPSHHSDRTLTVSASLGVTLYPQSEPVDADQLLRQADQAMYQAKLAGRNRYHFFDAEQDRSIRGQVERLEEIRAALENGDFVLHYQPKVNMRTGEIVGAEALIRWPLPNGGMRLPGEFLPLIENHPLAVTLDEWVIRQVLEQITVWHANGLQISVSVNVSAYHLQQTDFIERLKRLLEQHPAVDPCMLIIEILETTALMDLQRISEVIRTGQALGVVFALDDFGTGFSSLSYLKSLPAKQLKIDRSFVRDMLDDRDDLAILEGIMGLATAFSRQAIAEGVESVEHGEVLLQLGCEVAQGYGIGRPMPADKLPQWAAGWQPDPVWRRQRTIRREHLPLMFAMVEHRAWIKSVEARLQDGRTNDTLCRDGCHFDQWLNREGASRYGRSRYFEQIRSLHRRAHDLVPQLLQMYSDGQAEKARARLQELYGVRDDLVTNLKALLQEEPVQHDGRKH